MSPESTNVNEALGRDRPALPDFEPLYELSEEDYQVVINRLAGLLVSTIERLREEGQTDQAKTLASQAHDVLLSYDDDVAELVRSRAMSQPDGDGLGQAREKLLW